MINPTWFPDWYQGGYPDIEKVVESVFRPLLSDAISIVPFLPVDAVKQLATGAVYLRVARTSGHINGEQQRDQSRVQIAALTQSRNASWELIEFVRQVLEAINTGGGMWVDDEQALIRECGEVVGPQLIPEQIREDRLIPVTFDIWIGRPKGLTDAYPQALGL